MKLGNLLAFCDKYKVSVENLLREKEDHYMLHHATAKPRFCVSECKNEAENLFNLPERHQSNHPLIKEVTEIMESLDEGRKNRIAERARVIFEEQQAATKANTAS